MTMAKPRYDFDFAVAGGGPAGSSAAISLGQHGHSVVLFERDTFPQVPYRRVVALNCQRRVRNFGRGQEDRGSLFSGEMGRTPVHA